MGDSVEDLADELTKLSVQDSHNIDRHFNKELFQVSMKDRNAMTEELHGVSTLAREESPEFLEEKLREFSNELDAVSNDNPLKAAYLESQLFSNTYVNGSDFRLRFLRCELFDAKKSITRMLNFLSHTSDLFGPQVLERPIQIADFFKEDLDYMRLGNLQVLPLRDRSGRPIYTWVGDFDAKHGWKVIHKVSLYLHYIMSDDVESQQKGAIKLIWRANGFAGNESVRYSLECVKFNKKLFDSIPIRSAAVHVCVPNTPIFLLFKAGYNLATRGNTSKAKIRFHYGEEIELLYHLKGYGIPIELIPVHTDGDIKTKYLKQWMQVRKKLEQDCAFPDGSMIVLPGSHDVLFRKGESLMYHPGNSNFRGYIESRKQEHSTASQTRKKAITDSIIRIVQDKGGRFLEWNKRGWWMELGPSQIQAKVANQVRKFKLKSTATMKHEIRSSTYQFQNQDNAKAKRRKISPHSDGYCFCLTCDD